MKQYLTVTVFIFAVLVAVYYIAHNPTVGQKLSDNSVTPMETQNGNPSHAQIKLISPVVGQTINSPLSITGEARGTWFFEATFPVVLTNWDGLIIAEGYATAQGDWMTEEFVPFTAELEFVPDTMVSKRATLTKLRSFLSRIVGKHFIKFFKIFNIFFKSIFFCPRLQVFFYQVLIFR